jgi:putative transposase
MSTHYHLLVETPKGNISSGMHRLNGPYARWFNSRHGFEGHLFHNRFYSVAVESDVHLLEVFRYITLNPVRAGICNHAAHWPWSSYGAFAGSTPHSLVPESRQNAGVLRTYGHVCSPEV